MKRVLWAIGGLLVLLVATVLIGLGLVDWNQYKGDIQNQARHATGRELIINGDISITVFPAPALIDNDVLLANIEGAASKNMLRLKYLEVRLPLVPLLAGRIEVERIKLVDPEIELEVLADGRKNWVFDTDGPGTASQTIPGALPGAPSGEEKGPAAADISTPLIVLQNFTIENGSLTYRDGQRGTVERIEKINANITAASLNGPFESTGDLRLRGVPLVYDSGDYPAAAIAAIAFGKKATPVDANIERVTARLFAVSEPLPGGYRRISELARRLTPASKPRGRPGDFAQAMMDLGAMVCTPRAPDCQVCPLVADCRAAGLGQVERYPVKAPKKARSDRHGTVFWAVRPNGRVLLRQRPEKGLLGGMMEIPSTDWREKALTPSEAAAEAPVAADWKPLDGVVRHTFTHFHLELMVLAGRVRAGAGGGEWCLPSRFSEHALPTLMKKVARHVAGALAK